MLLEIARASSDVPGAVSIDLLTPPADARRFTSEKSELVMWQPIGGVVVQKASGHAPVALARFMTQRLNAFVGSGQRIVIFDDWQGISGYEAEARVVVTDWTRTKAAMVDRIHILLSSKIMAMAISVSNLALGGLSVGYTSRPEFERLLAGEVARRRS